MSGTKGSAAIEGCAMGLLRLSDELSELRQPYRCSRRCSRAVAPPT